MSAHTMGVTRTYMLIFLAFFSSLAFTVAQERNADIHVWPISAPKASVLARISYNSENATIKELTSPTVPEASDIVRVGFFHPSGSWSGVATSAKNFAAQENKQIQLHLNAAGELYHVGFRTFKELVSGTGAASKSKDGAVSVEVVKMQPGPVPHLNKPVALDAEGKLEAKEPEKSFFQKYWWVLAAFLLLQLVMGGGGKE